MRGIPSQGRVWQVLMGIVAGTCITVGAFVFLQPLRRIDRIEQEHNNMVQQYEKLHEQVRQHEKKLDRLEQKLDTVTSRLHRFLSRYDMMPGE